jgi:N-acetylmuramoyl-L-alanine amidase
MQMPYKLLRNFIFFIFTLVLCVQIIAGGTVGSMQVSRANDNVNISMYIRGSVQCKSFSLNNPYRIVADCPGAKLLSSPSTLLWRSTPVVKFRSSVSNRKLRMVWQLNKKTKYTLSNKTDFFGKKKLILSLGDQSTSYAKNEIQTTAQGSADIFNKIKGAWPRDTVIVIDPGHGGKDPGATSANKIHEKNVVLAISKNICRDINKKAGFKAYLTRSKDVFLSLRQRLRVARDHHADMFVAIHADAFNNSKANGASVFALSLRGATSEAARWIAERENQSELIGGVDLADKDKLLRSVLIDLSQSATIRTSLEVGKGVIGDLKSVARLHHNTVEQAAFVVLKSPDIPSLLVETGFLSNRREASQLNTASYQRKIAKAISTGIVVYFQNKPLPNTWLAMRKRVSTLTYLVRRGDSLSKIAHNFSVPAKNIKQANRLNSNNIKIGQKLLIPVPKK